MSRITPDDPRLTAYVLGELGDVERKELESLLADAPEAQAMVDALQGTTGQLELALAAEAADLGIGDERKESIEKPATVTSIRRSSWLMAAGLAAVLIGVVISNSGEPDKDVDSLREARVEDDNLAETALAFDTSAAPPEEGAVPAGDPKSQTTDAGELEQRVRSFRSKLGAPKANGATPKPDGSVLRTLTRARPGTTTGTSVKFVRGSKKTKPAATEAPLRTRLHPAAKPAPIHLALPRRPAQKDEKGWDPGDWDETFAEGTVTRDQRNNNEAYDHFVENAFLRPTESPLSTLSVDVDTAAYANVRRFLKRQQRPPAGAVRLEELINYFKYDDAAPTAETGHPVNVTTEVAKCWWNLQHKLVRVGLRAKDIPFEKRPFQNLVFLIDVSGSMQSQDKLPLLKDAFKLLVNTLGENDRVSIVVYASATGLVLKPTTGDHKDDILAAIDQLQAGGSTNGSGGIQLAYQTAVEHFVNGGNNRVILATDGDFNVGVTNRSDLIELIQGKAKSGVFLSVLGFGTGNLKDATMEQLADKGNGNYSYIDSVKEAEKVLVREMGGTLITVAKDVKLQVEFNPAKVAGYRLLGYENRILAAEDFNDDKKDAGEMGAGHSICALYEVVPAGIELNTAPGVDPLKYQPKPQTTANSNTTQKPTVTIDILPSNELLTVKLRYKQPDGTKSTKLEFPLTDTDMAFDEASRDLRWSSAVAAFGMVLRGSQFKGMADYPAIMEVCAGALGDDPHGDRKGFVELVTLAAQMMQR